MAVGKGMECFACGARLTEPGRGYLQLQNHLRANPRCRERVNNYYRALREHPRFEHGKERFRDGNPYH
jgi:hypothetical protein